MKSRETAISAHNVSKCYTITHRSPTESTLAETLLKKVSSQFRRGQNSTETFWALRNLDFEIRKGDVVGVIGRNGAGKSTLLKILSRITEPTSGQIDLFGRVGSLLEVGTGFHPELTGRENIYLNGAILGMRRPEITRQFDAIVEFSGVENFLDTPVKRYSSGMYVRLAFAVAAHLESEIMVVDEVLAVGDAEFQRKCLGKMKDVATGGRTVLFVSHHLQSVSILCNRAIYLENGTCAYMGGVEEAFERYNASFRTATRAFVDPDRRAGTGECRITEVSPRKAIFDCGEPKEINFRIETRKLGAPGAYLNVSLIDAMGAKLATCDMRTGGHDIPGAGEICVTLRIRSPWLKPGEYRIAAKICNFGTVDIIEDACRFTVSDVQPYAIALSDPLMMEGAALADYDFRCSS